MYFFSFFLTTILVNKDVDIAISHILLKVDFWTTFSLQTVWSIYVIAPAPKG